MAYTDAKDDKPESAAIHQSEKKSKYSILNMINSLGKRYSWLPGGAGLLSALLYAFTSGSIAFVNKIVVSSYDFPYPIVLVFIQMILTIIVLKTLNYFGKLELAEYTLEKGRNLLIPALCYAINTTFGIGALADLNIPMYTVLKRLGPLMNLILSVLILSRKPTVLTCVAIFIMVVGCVVAGINDLGSHIAGYISAIISVISQSFYLTYIEKTGADAGLTTSSLLYLNTLNCLPIQLIFGLITGDFRKAAVYPNLGDIGFQAAFFSAAGMGIILNYSIFLCTNMNSAITTSIVGVIKGLLITVIGFFTFGGVPASTLIITGVTINLVGAIVYAYAKFKEEQMVQEKKTDIKA